MGAAPGSFAIRQAKNSTYAACRLLAQTFRFFWPKHSHCGQSFSSVAGPLLDLGHGQKQVGDVKCDGGSHAACLAVFGVCVRISEDDCCCGGARCGWPAVPRGCCPQTAARTGCRAAFCGWWRHAVRRSAATTPVRAGTAPCRRGEWPAYRPRWSTFAVSTRAGTAGQRWAVHGTRHCVFVSMWGIHSRATKHCQSEGLTRFVNPSKNKYSTLTTWPPGGPCSAACFTHRVNTS
jgi:hypothetical protein